MGLISKKQLALNSVLVIMGLIIGAGTIMAVQAVDINLDDCDVLVNLYPDVDGDGYGDAEAEPVEGCFGDGYVDNNLDCNDDNVDINPDADEVCDRADNNCDGVTNDGIATSTYYRDRDGDEHGDASTTLEWCGLPDGYADVGDDCDDADVFTYPGAPETCDGIDNNCDGEINSDSTFYLDSDEDDYGNPSVATTSCAAPEGYVSDSTDCNDDDLDINPGITEVCDFLDNNCDGRIDEGLRMRIYYDWDLDGFGDPNNATSSCSVWDAYVSDNTDCDDGDIDVNPDADEVCEDDIDNDCDGLTDEGCGEETTWYRDEDGDSYGDPDVSVVSDSKPSGYEDNNEDCDDDDDAIHPGATEVCDFIDNDCDGTVDEGLRKRYYYDNDLDGYGDSSTATSSCQAPDGYISNNTDCDDDDADVNPGEEEICDDDIDNNCDGTVDEDCNGSDNDCDCNCDDHDCDRDWDDDNKPCGLFGQIFKNHGQFVSSVAHWTNQLKWEGKISGKIKGTIMSENAKNKFDYKFDYKTENDDEEHGDPSTSSGQANDDDDDDDDEEYKSKQKNNGKAKGKNKKNK